MTKPVTFLASLPNIAKAELFAFFNLAILWFRLLQFLTSPTGGVLFNASEDWNGLLGFFLSYLMPMFLAALLLDGVRHKNGVLCKLWLTYQLVVLMGSGILLFIADTKMMLSSRDMMITTCTILFKTIGAWIVLDFLRELELESHEEFVVAVMV